MSKSMFTVGASAVLFSTLTFAAPFPHPESTSMPLLSGTYVIAEQQFCQQTMAVAAKSGDVTTIKVTGNNENLSVGTVKFKQGATSGAGTLSITETTAGGSPLLATGSATSGSASDDIQENTGTVNTTFKQTATTFSFADGSKTNTFKAYYGQVKNGIVQYVAFGGVDDKGCAEQGTLTIE